MKNVIRLLLCCILLAASAACAVRPEGGDDMGDDDQPNPDPQPACEEDNDCDSPPTPCDVGTCSHGACSYQTSCESGEVCNAQGLCEEPSTPPPPSGRGMIVCSDPSGSSQTTVVISNGILDHLIGGNGLNPNSNWSVRFGAGSVGTDAKAWVSDASSYSLVVANTAALFNFVLQDPNGQQYWFDLNEFDVSGTCSHTTDATAITHVVPGSNPNPGNGTVHCAEVGSQTHVTISGGILAHLFDPVSPTSSWKVMFGYGGTDEEFWVSDSTSYLLTMPSAVTSFQFKLRSPGGQDYWFDVNEFNVSGTCSKTSGEFTHTAQSTGNGSISCSESGSVTNVTISNGILAHLFQSVTPNSNWKIRFGYGGGTDEEAWVSDASSYTLTMPSTVSAFQIILQEPNNGLVHWFDVSEFNVSGTCSKTSAEFTHGAVSVGNGSLHCAESGSSTIVTVSNGILAHLVGTPMYAPSLLQFEYGGNQTLNWISDSATYTFTMGNTITAFNLRLRDVNGNAFPFDVSEFNVSGTCSKTSAAFTHTAPTTTLVGTIRCQLVSVGGNVKREVTITPNSNGIINGTFQEGSPVSSPEYIRLGGSTDGQQQWVGNNQTYYFYAEPSTTNFNFFVADNNDAASGSDTVSGGDWFNLAAWTVENGPNIGHGASNCHVSGGGISVN